MFWRLRTFQSANMSKITRPAGWRRPRHHTNTPQDDLHVARRFGMVSDFLDFYVFGVRMFVRMHACASSERALDAQPGRKDKRAAWSQGSNSCCSKWSSMASVSKLKPGMVHSPGHLVEISNHKLLINPYLIYPISWSWYAWAPCRKSMCCGIGFSTSSALLALIRHFDVELIKSSCNSWINNGWLRSLQILRCSSLFASLTWAIKSLWIRFN